MKKLAFLGLRIGILMIVVAVGLLWKAPQVLPEPVRRIADQSGRILGVQDTSLDETKSQVGSWLTQFRSTTERFIQETTVPEIITGRNKEVVVEEVLIDLVNRVKHLPFEQAQTVKQQFCQDLINQATRSGDTLE